MSIVAERRLHSPPAMSHSAARGSSGALSPSLLSPAAAAARARARSSSTKSPASGHGACEEEDEAAWGITEGEDGDFKRRSAERGRNSEPRTRRLPMLIRVPHRCVALRIFELTARAHSDDRGHTHALELCFDDEIEDESAAGAAPKSAAHATQSIDFSTACWGWKQPPPHGQSTSEEDDRMRSLSASLASTASLQSSRASSSASTPHDPPTTNTTAANATRPAAASNATNGSAAASSASGTAASFTSAASASAHHHHGSSFHAAGLGRNMSLDCSARELGLSIQYVERLALPLLRSEIHSFFQKLLARVGILLAGLESNPVRVLRKMQAGMHSNSLATADAELKRNFNVSETQLAAQIAEIINADPSLNAEQKTAALQAAVAEPSASASPPAVASPSSPLSPSPPAPASTSAAPFVAPLWWPSSLQASHASLLRMRALFSMFADGFDDSKNGGGGGAKNVGGAGNGHAHSHLPSPPRSSAAAQAAASVIGSPPARKMFGPTTHAAGGGGGSAFKPPSHPASSPVSKSSAAHSHPRLQALPTTRSNRDGLKCLARLVQSFSLLVAMEGGAMAQATRLAVALQRMSNTLLEKHHLEESLWMQREQ